MDSLTVRDYIMAAIAIWLAALTLFLIRAVSRDRKLTRGQEGQNLTQILEKLARGNQLNQSSLEQLSAEIAKIKTANRQNFQKYALVRFNPFEDTGGDQSFVAAILDGQNNGLVISSLHSRDATRVYAKQVEGGQPTTHKFSREEQEVVEKAAHGIS